MDERVENAVMQSPVPSDTNGLYCEECLRVDRSFSDIPNSAIKLGKQWLTLSLKANVADIKEDTPCPSCRDLLDLLVDRPDKGGSVKLFFYIVEGLLLSVEAGGFDAGNAYLLWRSLYPKRLRSNSPTTTRAANLPITKIKSWLQTCQRKHKACQQIPANEMTTPLYLIDVVEECVTFMPVLEENYVALSYVWGNVECTKLTTKNMEILRRPGSLSSESHVATVPRTIRDAMHLTADLDIRYLWVDCLSLRQDDPSISLYLDQMHLIYHNAYLTIVVANKASADGGITGYETCSTGRELSGRIINYPNYVLGIKTQYEAEAEAGSDLPWFSRGWTLQEGFFSRRVLVISDWIYLKCAEDASEEGADFGFKVDENSSPMIKRLLSSVGGSSAKIHPTEAWSQQDLNHNRWTTYSKVVDEFASRSFSYDSDVMKAFLGVISFFTRPDESEDNLNTDLLYGHPVQTLHRSLLWTPRERALHRPSIWYPHDDTIRRRNLGSRQDGVPVIPSWSWMAWQHGVLVDLCTYFPFYIHIPLNTPTVIQAQCSTCLQTHKTSTERCSNEASLERIDPEYLQPYLLIKAQRGQFGVSIQLEEDEKDEIALLRVLNVQNQDPSFVGEIFFDVRPPFLPSDGVGALDFVGITCYEEPVEGLIVDALCIKPVEDCPGVFERVGVAWIRKHAWDQVAQFDDNIILG